MQAISRFIEWLGNIKNIFRRVFNKSIVDIKKQHERNEDHSDDNIYPLW